MGSTHARAPHRALAERRKAQAVELAAQGLPYELIAREVGYANRVQRSETDLASWGA